MEKNKVLNIANGITLSRIIFGFVFLILFFLINQITFNNSQIVLIKVISFFVYLIAIITDGLDGYAARKLKLVSDFGKHFDPIADSIFFIIVFSTFTYIRLMPLILLILVAVREGAMHFFMRPFSQRRGFSLPANIFGKMKTVFQSLFCAFILLMIIAVDYRLIKIELLTSISFWLFIILVINSYLSLFTYIPLFIRNIKSNIS